MVFATAQMIPHGHCYLWQPDLVRLHLVSDGLTAISYYSIPLSLIVLVRKRDDLPFNWVFLLFAAFILACGTTHALSIWTLWHPDYWLSGSVKAVTAFVSVWTALMLISATRQVIKLPPLLDIESANQQLRKELKERQKIEQNLAQAQKSLELINQDLESSIQLRTQELADINQQLHQKTAKLEAIFQSIPDAVIFTDPKGYIQSCNQATTHLFEFSPQELIGRKIETLKAPTDPAQDNSQDGLLGQNCEVVYLCKNGQTFLGETVLVQVSDERGKPTGQLGIIEDITERKTIEEARTWAEIQLRLRETQLSLFVEHTPAAVAMFDRDLRYVLYSRRWLEDYRLGTQDLTNRSHYDVFPEVPDRWKALHQRCLAGEVLTCEEEPFLRDNGDIDWIRWELHPWYREAGQIGGLIMLTEVITETKRLHQKIRAQKQLQSFFEATSTAQIGAAIFDENLRYMQINQAMADISGLSVADHIGKSISNVNPDMASKTLSIFERVMRENKIIREEVEGHIASEPEVTRYWLMSYFPVLSDAKASKQVGVVTLEITRRKQNEEKLKDLNIELQRSNQELEQFAYVASHDLREPLRKIRSYSDLLVRRYQGQLDERADKYIAYITDGAMRMMNLINDLLKYSRVGQDQIEHHSLPLGTVLDQVMSDLQPKIHEAQAKISVLTPLPIVRGNAVQMRQLLQNLLENSLKYRSDAIPSITINAVPMESFWQISISDNGIGIDPQFADRIFIIFQRLHVREAYQGTGIGLAVCKRIVERHGGKIWVDSQPGEGATFYFTLPKE